MISWNRFSVGGN